MASVSTNKLGALAEQSVEEPASGAPKLEAMVEVKFKVRKLAVLLQTEENVTPSPPTAPSIASKTTITLARTHSSKSEGGGGGLGLAVKSASARLWRSTTAVMPTAGVPPQRLQHELKQIVLAQNIEGSTFLVGQKAELGSLRQVEATVKCVEVVRRHKALTQAWAVPKSFVFDLPKLLSFEQHLNEVKRLEHALVLVGPAKLLVLPQISRERILIEVMDVVKSCQTPHKTLAICSRKTLANIDFFAQKQQTSVKSSTTIATAINKSQQSYNENVHQIELQQYQQSNNKVVIDTVCNPTESQNTSLVKCLKNAPKGAFLSLVTHHHQHQTLHTTIQAIKANFQISKQQKVPQKFERTLKAALDLALLGQTKFQLKWKRSDELRKSALKCHAKVKWPLRDCLIETRTSKTHFSKWEASESLQLLRKQKRVSTRLDVLEKQKSSSKAPIEIIAVKSTVCGEANLHVTIETSREKCNQLVAVNERMGSKSTFFDLHVLNDDISLSGKDSDTDCLSDTRSLPETLTTTSAEEDGIVDKESSVTLANEVEVVEDAVNAAAPLKPAVTHDRFLMKLLEDLSAPEDATNGQEVQLLYLRKTPFIEEDEDLMLPVKPFKETTAKPNKYLMELLNKKHTSEEDLIDIDAESDDWDEELDPDVDGIEFFDSEEHDCENSDVNEESNANAATPEPAPETAVVCNELSCVGTKILFGNITDAEYRDDGKANTIVNQKGEIKPIVELPLVALSRFHVVPNTPEPQSTRKYPSFKHDIDLDDERPSCSKFRNVKENFGTSTLYSMKYKQMHDNNDKLSSYQSELQTVLKKIRLLSEVDELDQSCVYEEADTEQRLYMKKNGEWLATEPSESDEESRNEKRAELPTTNPLEAPATPRALLNESLTAKRFWMLSELRKRFGLKTAKYDPTKKRPGMIIDSENWEEAYSESTFWNAHKNSFEKVRVLAKKGRFKFAIISEAQQNRKAETSDEGEESDKSSSDEDKEGCCSLQRKHSSFEIRQPNCQTAATTDDGEVFFQPINCRAFFGAKCIDRRWALPPSRIYRFSRSFGRILKLYMKRPELETILEEREPNEDANEAGEINASETTGKTTGKDELIKQEVTAPVSVAVKEECECELLKKPAENNAENDKAQNVTKIRKKPDKSIVIEAVCSSHVDDDNVEHMINSIDGCFNSEKNTSDDWFYCFFNDNTDEPIDEDYFADLSDFD